MGFFGKIAGLFSRASREESQLQEGLEHAKAKRPEKALEVYNVLLSSPHLNPTVKASALFNRALAHSALDDDEKAMVDLQKVLALPNLPDNIQTAARARVARVKKRAE